jgi:hypothetical protein
MRSIRSLIMAARMQEDTCVTLFHDSNMNIVVCSVSFENIWDNLMTLRNKSSNM